MSENTLWAVLVMSVAVVLGTLCLSAVQCTKIEKDSFNECVKSTQKPLECRSRMNGQ